MGETFNFTLKFGIDKLKIDEFNLQCLGVFQHFYRHGEKIVERFHRTVGITVQIVIKPVNPHKMRWEQLLVGRVAPSDCQNVVVAAD